MANMRAAQKHVRQTIKRTMSNRIRKSRMRTLTRRFEQAVQAGEREQAEELFRRAVSAVDIAAKKKTIHPNKADRTKSRLRLRLNALSA